MNSLGQPRPARRGGDALAVSGVALLPEGLGAFAERLASVRGAAHSLDLQYYIWHNDLTGALLAREVLHAADRGVRVRLLLDALNIIGKDGAITALAAHPRIKIRRFNAGRLRSWGQLGFLLEMLLGGWHLNRRMHNKAWIADGVRLICGGRNIGDRYFDAGGDFNFRDLDLRIIGPAAEPAAAIFEAYWRSPLARPLGSVARLRARRASLRRLRRLLDRRAAVPHAAALLALVPDVPMLRVAEHGLTILADPPAKASGQGNGTVAPALMALLATARREALIISPYFVPGQVGTALLARLAASGVRVSVITNSLAATDVVAVHGGYARYRPALLAAGIELHEVKASVEAKLGLFGSRGASLHTKAVMVDDGPLFVGSFNMDPRSAALNTEMGVMLDHRALARLLRRQHRRLADGGRSWRVQLQGGRLSWTDGRGPPLRHEPGATLRRRLVAWLTRWLPVESQL